MRRRSGYTLLELVVVVLILTLMFGLAATRVEYLLPKYRLRGAARETAAVLKQARARAASSGQDTYVRFHLSEGRYELLAAFPVDAGDLVPFEEIDPDAELAPEPEIPRLQYEAVIRRQLPEGTQFTSLILGSERERSVGSGTATIRVTPYGLSDHLLVNFHMDDRPMALRLNGLTGRVQFYERELEPDELLEDREE